MHPISLLGNKLRVYTVVVEHFVNSQHWSGTLSQIAISETLSEVKVWCASSRVYIRGLFHTRTQLRHKERVCGKKGMFEDFVAIYISSEDNISAPLSNSTIPTDPFTVLLP